ncbi:hypothetical protein Bealeia2_02068 (plasmid) [Candidatus Bealeia paramacronuclearis]|nr:hypothetical protein [Candidatus Bealeia paramacronuclearis]
MVVEQLNASSEHAVLILTSGINWEPQLASFNACVRRCYYLSIYKPRNQCAGLQIIFRSEIRPISHFNLIAPNVTQISSFLKDMISGIYRKPNDDAYL